MLTGNIVAVAQEREGALVVAEPHMGLAHVVRVDRRFVGEPVLLGELEGALCSLERARQIAREEAHERLCLPQLGLRETVHVFVDEASRVG